MRWTPEQYADYMAKRARTRTCAKQKECQAGNQGTSYCESEVPEVVPTMHKRFCVSIAVFYSDNRRRDLDGALVTLLDCMISAVKQLPKHLRELLPQDDSWQWISTITIAGFKRPKGQEGALIKIEPLI